MINKILKQHFNVHFAKVVQDIDSLQLLVEKQEITINSLNKRNKQLLDKILVLEYKHEKQQMKIKNIQEDITDINNEIILLSNLLMKLKI